MKKKAKQGYEYRYPKRDFLIYPNKYGELFIVLPVCFCTFFLKGGGWFFAILILVTWFILAIAWTNKYYRQDCERKGKKILYKDGEPVQIPHDFHDDPHTHKHDELHFLFHSKTQKWESRQEVIDRYKREIEEYPEGSSMREFTQKLNDVAFKKIDECWQDDILNGR